MTNICLVPLHKYKEYMKETCIMINEEWERSDTARMRSLESSTDELPTSLILLFNNIVIGHVKLSPIPNYNNCCFFEIVVIKKSYRGKGFGTILMKLSEDYCKTNLKLKSIYLSTKGQENFYFKLGYKECCPISLYGNYISKCQDFNKTPLPNTSSNINRKIFMKKDLQ